MRRSGVAKFPNSVQLFKFCQKVLADHKGAKVHDQEVGCILKFNPSDCSHWKRGEKNVKSVFAFAKLAEALNVDISLIHDIASGQTSLEEAFFEYKVTHNLASITSRALEGGIESVNRARKVVTEFSENLLKRADFSTPPLYLPEILTFFPFVNAQPVEMVDKLSRVLRKKPGHYSIHFCRKELKPQTRMSMALDLARILFEAERDKFPELGALKNHLLPFEELLFTADILVPKSMLLEEFSNLDPRKNVFAELSSTFWVPKALIGFQLQEVVRVREQKNNKSKMETSTTNYARTENTVDP
jgi:hypothetical protein